VDTVKLFSVAIDNVPYRSANCTCMILGDLHIVEAASHRVAANVLCQRSKVSDLFLPEKPQTNQAVKGISTPRIVKGYLDAPETAQPGRRNPRP
jgi:hypothetical protein